MAHKYRVRWMWSIFGIVSPLVVLWNVLPTTHHHIEIWAVVVVCVAFANLVGWTEGVTKDW